MADGLLGARDAPDLSSKAAGVDAGPPRQDFPQIVAPGLLVVSTQSGKAAIVTAAPSSYYNGNSASLLTDPRTFTITFASTPTSSTIPTATPTQSSSSSPSSTSAPSHGLSTAKLAAVIVVPLVLLAILSPILIVWCISYRRKRRAAKRRSERLSAQKPLIDRYQTASNHQHRSSSKPPRPKRPHRIVSVPTPTFSSFNFGFSRPASAGPSPQSHHNLPSRRNRRSTTTSSSWTAPPPPYSSGSRRVATRSSTPIPRLDTPDFPSSPLLETAQMVHIRPISGQQRQQSYISNNRSNTRLPPSSTNNELSSNTSLQPPANTYTNTYYRRASDEESLHHRSTLNRPFSFQAPSSPALSDISGLSFDPTLWASSVYGRSSTYDVSPVDDDDEGRGEGVGAHQMV
ncbi:MAG: hypothetical protein Q9222_006845 [Ikaeria aurantiellina]